MTGLEHRYCHLPRMHALKHTHSVVVPTEASRLEVAETQSACSTDTKTKIQLQFVCHKFGLSKSEHFIERQVSYTCSICYRNEGFIVRKQQKNFMTGIVGRVDYLGISRNLFLLSHVWKDNINIKRDLRTFLHYMESEGSLPCSQECSTGPFPEQDQFTPYRLIISKTHINIILPSTFRSSYWSPSFRLSNQVNIKINKYN
jgi:hypothetical protein